MECKCALQKTRVACCKWLASVRHTWVAAISVLKCPHSAQTLRVFQQQIFCVLLCYEIYDCILDRRLIGWVSLLWLDLQQP